MSKSTPLSVQNAFNSALKNSQESATSIKEAHRIARQAIKDDPMTSDLAKRGKLDSLAYETKAKLDGLKADQASFVKGLRDKVEKEFRGDQPSDAASVVSRRDAADRARKITDKREVMEVLQDAIAGNDADFAHALGVKARNNGWVDAAEVYTGAFPDTAGSAEALDYLDANASGAGYNMFNSMTFSAPQD
ncbi:hypothetical protein F1C58_12100 [Glaciihabitans sp. INWT7]|uniref:hypothetical protein n=1 Tax=Glaciihabitans sp. INWT7 TaxID=2596912 RepID=UPI001623A23A|nr:hypothetical protein [Glaciihabitans sp. INWT7]QNE47568.1 hypothetical protein F1C58_12100 [Glaciihabitans sp. INWT7]